MIGDEDAALASLLASGPSAPDETAPGAPTDEPDAAVTFDRRVAAEVDRLRVREAAGRLVARERVQQAPGFVRLDALLAVPDEPVMHRIDRLQPVGSRVVCAAQFKAGKSTLVENLTRSLVDGQPFLGTFAVEPLEGRVALIDDELDPRMLRRWLRAQGIRNTGSVVVVPLRGSVGSFDVLDEECRAGWAARLREAGVSYVILDCLRPVLDALGLDEHREAGRFLTAFDALLEEAGVSEALVVHHMGHAGERSRGDSRIRDWPDVEWRLVREKETDSDDAEPNAPRYFSAFGRDVDEPETLLSFDPDNRRLTVGGGSRRDTRRDRDRERILDFLATNPGASKTAVEKGVTGHGETIREALDALVADGIVTRTKEGQAQRHTLTASTPSNPVHPVSDAAGYTPSTPSIGTGYPDGVTDDPDHVRQDGRTGHDDIDQAVGVLRAAGMT